jgi:hypothetical protein
MFLRFFYSCVFWVGLVWGQDLRAPFPFLTCTHVPLGFMSFVFFGWFSVDGICALPFPHLRMFHEVMDLVFFKVSFSVGTGSALPFFSSTCACSLGVLILFFGISLVWGRDLRAPFPFPHLRTCVPLSFGLCF